MNPYRRALLVAFAFASALSTVIPAAPKADPLLKSAWEAFVSKRRGSRIPEPMVLLR